MANRNVRRANKSEVSKATTNNLEIYQDDTDSLLYYKDINGRVVPLDSGGLASVTSDATLSGAGTVLSPLSVVSADVQAEMSFAASDQTTPLTVANDIAGMFAPFDMQMNNMAFSAIRVEGGPGFPTSPLTVTTVNINVNGVTVVLNLSIEAGEATSLTFTPTTYPAPTYIQIGGAPPIINKGDYISVDVTALSTDATEAGLQITINGIRI